MCFFCFCLLSRSKKANWLSEEKKKRCSGQLLSAADHSNNISLDSGFLLQVFPLHRGNLKPFGFNAEKVILDLESV